ncbi:MAG: HYR domain-containing protein [Bacteroidia bacterium]
MGTLVRLSNNTPQLVFFNRISINDITPLCPGQTSPCPNSTNAFGLEEHILQADVPSLYPNEDYRFQVTNSARNLSITTGAANQTMFVYVNFRTSLQNSSPRFLNRPVATFCVNQPAVFSPNGYDPDGDAIVYALQTCWANSTTATHYNPGYSPTNPLSSSTPIVLNPNTGAISFTPSVPGEVAIICLRADEYRDGVLVGSVVRDMQVIVSNCTNATPSITNPGNVVVNPGQSYCVSFSAEDTDGDPITLSAVGGILPPATFVQTVNQPGLAEGTFCFTPNLGHAGRTYTVTVNAMDGSCPSPGIGVATFNITVPAPCGMSVSVQQTSPCGAAFTNLTSIVNGGEAPYSYTWTGPSGFTAFTPQLQGLLPGTYHLTVVDGNSCVATTSILVGNGASNLEVTPYATNTTCGNANGTVNFALVGGAPPYQYALDGGPSQSGSLFTGLATGMHTYLLSDANGCTLAGQVIVGALADIIAPTIQCPADQVMAAAPGLCGASVAFASATASDNCSLAAVNQVSGPASGSFLAVGQHVVVYSATDAEGNEGTCATHLTVEDHEAPSIVCGSNSTMGSGADSLANDLGQCTAVFSFTNAATDNCGAVVLTQIAGLPSGSGFPIGATLNAFVATDAAGNTSSCAFEVVVMDAEAPLALCQDVTVLLDGAGFGSLSPAAADAGSTDNCGSVLRTVSVGTYSCADLGVNPAQLLISDSQGNSSSCGFLVTVVDPVAPVAICQNVTLAVPGSGLTLNPGQLNGGSQDACGITTLAVTPSSFGCGSSGIQSVTLTVSDGSGNASTCTSQVSLQANPISIQLSSPLNACGYNVSNCCGAGNGGGSGSGSGSGGSGSGSGSGGEGHHGSGSGHECRTSGQQSHGGGHGHGGCGGGNLGGPSTCGRDGRINVAVTGGCGDLSYAWSNGGHSAQFTGLTPGMYVVTVTDANGNSGTASIVLSQTPTLVAQVTGQNVSCFGLRNGSLVAQGAGGCPPYQYRWSNGASTAGISSLGVGSYAVTVTDGNGCTVVVSRAVTQPTRLVANAGAHQVTYPAYAPQACANLVGSASGGTSAYSYTWAASNGLPLAGTAAFTACPTVTTVYRLRVTDARGCTAVDSVAVCPIDIGCGSNKVQICHTVVGRYGYSQSRCLPASQVASHLDHGDRLGACGSRANCTFPRRNGQGNGGSSHKSADGETVLGNELSGRVYPNPTNGKASFELVCEDCEGGSQLEWVLTDLLGREIRREVSEMGESGAVVGIDLVGYPAGVYHLAVAVGGRSWSERILKR